MSKTFRGRAILPGNVEGEALVSRTPVITSKGSCFNEAGGQSSLYVDPDDTDEMIHAIRLVLEDQGLRKEMQEKGHAHALGFREEVIAGNLMGVYRKVL